jgi:general secretion pathway protein G
MKKKAFTLIELLIVVAIIAILAAIAVPNFLDAQVRSKVSRVKADIRSIATGIESYSVDHNRVPRQIHTGWYTEDQAMYAPETVYGVLWWGLSTPIAYLTSIDFIDPFQKTDVANRTDERRFTYQDMLTYTKKSSSDFWPAALEFYGVWRMASVGPDKTYNHAGIANSGQLCYDPTNGTVSPGNIWRSQKSPDSVQPPVGVLLGAH